jgi:hypothetical protein
LFINRPHESHVGLFGEVGQEGVTKQIGVVNVTVVGNDYVGSLMGYTEGSMRNSYSTGGVAGHRSVGGPVGTSPGTVSNSYSVTSVTDQDRVGGLLANNWGTVSNSFWDVQPSGQTRSAGGTGKTTAKMKNFDTFWQVGWSITRVDDLSTRDRSRTWNIVDNDTYPFLSWQSVSPLT